MAKHVEKTINNGEYTWAEFMELYHNGADIIFEYKGRELMLGVGINEKGECVRAMQEHVGKGINDPWPDLMYAPYGDDDWLLHNFKIDGVSVYDFLPMARVTGT